MQARQTRHDVVVVGGRVAGAMTAARLAARGRSVLVLESRERLSGTLSTHFFRGDGLVRGLAEVGVLEQVLATGAPPLTCQYSYSGGGDVPTIGPPQEPGTAGFCLSVRREALDALLASHVSRVPGVTFRTGVKVVDVLRREGAVAGVRDESGDEHFASVVVGADGRRSRVARLVRANVHERHPAARVMYYRYVTEWTGPQAGCPDGAEFSLLDNEQVYVFPSDRKTACVALTVGLDRYTEASSHPEHFFDTRIKAHHGIWPRLRRSVQRGRIFVGPLQDSVIRQAAGPGWALVGDAGTYQDPWTGFGMDTAARQAEVLAQTLLPNPAEWNDSYSIARDGVTLERFTATVTAAPDLSTLVRTRKPTP